MWIEGALGRYVRALDAFDAEESFLKLWATLEYLTLKHRSEETVGRASFITKEPEYHRQVLTNLGHLRNRAVHGGEASQQRETHIYQLKQYVENLLDFHFRESRHFDRPEEATEVLDLPPNSSKLRNMRRRLDIGLRMQGG